MNSNYEIYSASAGSGKTFTLTASYLAKFLEGSNQETYRKILALTFTNKASEEMKTRILSSLKEFSILSSTKNPSDIFKAVKDRLKISYKEIHIRAKKRLNILLHNYSFFNVTTLDSFSHNIIRSFAKELKIVSDFKLILDSEEFINESIERLLSQVGENKQITKALIDFANSKISEGKSWDITYDLKELSSLLANENHYNKIKELEDISMTEFLLVKENIFISYKELEMKIINQAKISEGLIKSKNLKIVFSRNSYPSFLKKIKNKDFKNIKLEPISGLFERNTLITKTSSKGIEKDCLELSVDLLKIFKKTEKDLNNRNLLKAFYDTIIPVSVLNQIKKILQKIQKEKGELLISEFNKIIKEEIKDQPAPYIFEKTGNRIKHYLIDEFQDTSMLQWSNLTPLISHSIESGENENDIGSLVLVGDPKQSLYRWRGANPDKFISLLNSENPFTVNKKNRVLTKNYRSKDNIVLFNNSFFEHYSRSFVYDENKEIYKLGSSQELKGSGGGYVSIEFIEKQKDKTVNEQFFLEKTLNTIKDCISRNFLYSDQCILVRNKYQQRTIADFLIQNSIPVISAEALLIKNSSKVSLLVELIRLRTEPENLSSRRIVINYLIQQKPQKDIYNFYEELLSQKIEDFFLNISDFRFKDFTSIPVYDAVAKIQRKLGFDFGEDSHIQFFLDELFDFFSTSNKNEIQFLDFWKKNKEKLNVVTGGELDAVQILTIHKAKGLEFPVVIYPFADSSSQNSNSQRLWFPYNSKETSLSLLIPYGKTIENAGETGHYLYNKRKKEEELDNANVLYVALTRAINEIHIIATLPKKVSVNSHNEVLRSFLEESNKWEKDKLNYNWGEKIEKYSTKPKAQQEDIFKVNTRKTTFIPNLNSFYENEQIRVGNLFHQLMSRVQYAYQFESELNLFRNKINVDKSTVEKVIELAKKTINNKSINKYFSKKYEVICEKEIFTKEKNIIIPDRIVVCVDQSHTIIEYKTGEKKKEHVLQILKYADVLKDMGLNVEKSILVYIAPVLEVIEL